MFAEEGYLNELMQTFAWAFHNMQLHRRAASDKLKLNRFQTRASPPHLYEKSNNER